MHRVKISIEPRVGVWFALTIAGITLQRCRLHRGPGALPDLRLPHGVTFSQELFAAARRKAVAVMGERMSG